MAFWGLGQASANIALLAQGICEPDPFHIKPPEVLRLEELTFSTFHILTLIIFLCAILHTFAASRISSFAKRLGKKPKQIFFSELISFLGEIEVIFALWVIPLFLVIFIFYDWVTAIEYISTRNYTEPLFIVVVMALTASRPIVKLAEDILHFVAKLLGNTVQSWWLSLLVLGPLLGSLVTEAGAMTITATLLVRQFYVCKPSSRLAYATIGLLFANISIGGLLTTFAAPPVLIVARCWEWTSSYMFMHFGMKAIIGVCLSTLLYLLLFQSDFKEMHKKQSRYPKDLKKDKAIPFWITIAHVIFIVWTVANAHYPAIFIASFLLYLGFQRATRIHQNDKGIKNPLLVGLFLAGLIIHGGLQGWWINPVLSGLGPLLLMTTAVVLTSFNDNAAVVYLSSLLSHLDENIKIAIVSGAMTGGGLTVIANAPNPAGYVILRDQFAKGISPLYLFLGALLPTLIFYVLFSFPFWL